MANDSDSILTSIKKLLGIDEDYEAFDVDIKIHINSAFNTLHQLAVGPATAFVIEGKEETWAQFLEGKVNLNSVKTYVYIKVRLLFDPPETSFARDALKAQADEYEWRLNVEAENQNNDVPPAPTPPGPVNLVEGYNGAKGLWLGTKEEYEALESTDSKILYGTTN